MKNQSGRSMVEMLAVLAIMGVLSITGIYAYNLAMTKHKANELIHKANLAYMNVLAYDSLDSWSDLKITSIDGTPLQGVIYKDAGFVLIENIDKDVCNAILNDKTNFSLMQTTNVAFTVCESTNSMVFDFANAGDFGAKCIAGKCPLESDGQYCSTNTNTCIMETDCPDGEWNFDIDGCGTCESVNGETAPISSENGCISCAESTNDAKQIWDSENKTCINCQSDNDCNADSYCANTTCTNCPENSGTTETNNGQLSETSCYCLNNYTLSNESCIPNCPANSAISGTGNTTSNPLCKCNTNTPVWKNNSCVACEPNYIFSNGSCIANCPANSATNGTGNVTSNPLCKCVSGKLWWNGSYCQGCNAGYQWNGSTCVALTVQQKCAAAGSSWTYIGGECLAPWSSYGSPSSYCNGKCETIGLALVFCESNAYNFNYITKYFYRPHCR